MALPAGTRFGPYEIERVLGAGGMGEVYRARDTRLERMVAVKILNSALANNPDLKSRFEHEAKTISQLNHPNICTLYDVGQHKETDYLVMKYLEGESLADRLKRGPLALPDLIRIGCDIADALDRAHRAGIVHRGNKPEEARTLYTSRSFARVPTFWRYPKDLALSSVRARELGPIPKVIESSNASSGSSLSASRTAKTCSRYWLAKIVGNALRADQPRVELTRGDKSVRCPKP